jgi:hypothetical protein
VAAPLSLRTVPHSVIPRATATAAAVVAILAALAFSSCRLDRIDATDGSAARRVVAGSSDFVPNEMRMTDPLENIVDPEYDHDNRRFTYINDGKIYVVPLGAGGTIDLAARDLVDSRAVVRATTNVPFGNGPEWGFSLRGWEIYYTKKDSHGNPYVAVAWQTGEHQWAKAPLFDSLDRFYPIPSVDPFEFAPRLFYGRLAPPPIPHTTALEWRYAYELGNHPLDAAVLVLNGPARWVPGQRKISASIVEVQDAGPVSQAVLYNVETGTIERVTANTSPGIVYDEVWSARAPEYGNQYVVWAVENRENASGKLVTSSIKLFVKDQNGQWAEERDLKPVGADPATPFVISPEPFVFNDHSYIAMLLSPTPAQRIKPTSLWVVDLQGFERQVLPANSQLARLEPEPMELDGSLYIYYSAQELDAAGSPVGNKMIYRADAGL